MFLTVKNKFLDISHINAVICDMDGTLVESEHIWSEAKQSIARDAGINITEDGLNKSRIQLTIATGWLRPRNS